VVFPSSWISQSIASQNSMFSGMNAYSAQISHTGGMLGGPPPMAMPAMPPPPPPSLMGTMRGYGGYMGGPSTGMYGEQLAGRIAGASQTAFGVAGAGMGLLSAAGSLGLIGGPLGAGLSMMDPIGLSMRAAHGAFGMMGGGMGGLAAGGLAAGAIALPMYAGAQWAGGLARNFVGGMQDQTALNSTLRQNFNFLGGQGSFGRGFSQQQMGSIGGMISQELRSNVFTSAGELNNLIGGGSQMGMFSGVRDVQEFGKRFREMLGTLKSVQRELGGSLQEALQFVNQSRQAGIFQSADRMRFASTIREVSTSTGFDQGQLMQMATQGAQISRSFGGNGNQGAFGALRSISTVSSALQGGMISEGMLSEATGGLTGADAMQSFVGDMMQRTGRLTRRAHGRYGIFGLSNRDGTGLDEGAMMRFQMGDIGVGELSRMAHRNVGHMGRARAVNREGILRGAAMEQGGLAFQLGQVRQIIGDRAMDQGDDLASLVIQRRMGMSRPQAEVMTSLLRNQTQIAQQEQFDRVDSARESGTRNEIREHRSVDAFMREVGHGLAERTHMTRAREMGREFTTRLSSLVERAMNDVLGIASEGNMSATTRQSHRRMMIGAGRSEDYALARLAAEGADTQGVVSGRESFSRGLLQTGLSLGERMERFGFDTSGYGGGRRGTRRREWASNHFGGDMIEQGAGLSSKEMESASRMMILAGSGVVSGRSAELLRGLEANQGQTGTQIMRAMAAARGTGDETQFMSFLGGNNANPEQSAAYAAYMARHGMHNPLTLSSTDVRMAGQGGGISLGMIGRDLLRGAGAMAVAGSTGGVGLANLVRGALSGQSPLRSEIYDHLTGAGQEGQQPQDAAAYFASGGIAARKMRDSGERGAEIASGISDLDVDVMRTTMGRADVRSASAQLLSDDPTARANAAARLRDLATTEPDPAQRAALTSLAENAAHAAQSNDPETRRAFLDAAIPEQERNAYIRETQAVGRNYSVIAQMVGQATNTSLEGGPDGVLDRMLADARFGDMGERLGAIGAAYSTGDAASAGARMEEFVSNAASMGDDEAQELITRLTSLGEEAPQEAREQARSLAMHISATRQQRNDLRGEGRRGMRQSRETALSMLSGGSLGSMEFTLRGRRVRGNRIGDMLLGRGVRAEDREELLNQFQAQLSTQNGMSDEAARDIRGTLSRVYEDNEVTDDEAREIQQTQKRYGVDFERISREQQERALSNATSRDPVGREQIRILGEISSTLQTRLAPREGGAEPANYTPG
jgi:hypothetical protein